MKGNGHNMAGLLRQATTDVKQKYLIPASSTPMNPLGMSSHAKQPGAVSMNTAIFKILDLRAP